MTGLLRELQQHGRSPARRHNCQLLSFRHAFARSRVIPYRCASHFCELTPATHNRLPPVADAHSPHNANPHFPKSFRTSAKRSANSGFRTGRSSRDASCQCVTGRAEATRASARLPFRTLGGIVRPDTAAGRAGFAFRSAVFVRSFPCTNRRSISLGARREHSQNPWEGRND